MVLRSACSHGRSHKFVKNTNGQKQESALQKRKSIKATSEELYIAGSDKDSLKVDSPFESSLELLALKSSKTFAVLKESLFNQLQLSRSQKCEITQLSKEDLGFVKKLNFSETSSPVTSLHLNAHFESTEFSDYVQDIEKDLSYNTTAMSRTRRLERSSARTLSESETEEDASFYENRVRLKRNKTSNAVLHTNSTGEKRFSQSLSNVYTSSNHSNSIRSVSTSAASPASSSRTSVTNYSYNSTPIGYSTPFQRNLSLNSAQMNMSAVQYSSSFDRLRWLIWRFIYLKIITIVNFDVWLLSRLCGRRKVVAILLLPLLLYLLYHLLGANTGIMSKSYDVLSSSIATLASSIYSLLSHPLKQSEKVVIVEESSCPLSSSSFSAFWGIPSFFSNIFIAEKSTSFSSKSSSSDAKATSSEDLFMRQEIESNVVKTLDTKFNELSRKIQVSQDTKDETMKMLHREISDLHVQFKNLAGTVQQLEKDMQNKDKSASTKDIENLSKEHAVVFNSLNTQIKTFEKKLASLNSLKSCCDDKWTPSDFINSIEKHLVTAFRNVIAGEKNADSPYYFFHQWLNSKFINPSELSTEINSAFEKMKSQQSSDVKLDQSSMTVVKNVVQYYVDSLKTNLTNVSGTKGTYSDSLSSEDMRRIVKEALMLYDADKTGKVDYALESGGGSILSTRCTESYVEKNGKFTVLGVPLWSGENSPRTAIQPDVQPGKCWAFKGSQGYLVIQLSYTIYPTGFTLEHIPVSLSPTGSIDSAPKDFSVWGLASEKDYEGTLLGNYSFDKTGEPLQYFPIQNISADPFLYVEVKILSNQGNMEYTCLYRFRVHGTRA
ncbi:hypothetical protein CDAR_541631 [Caerostris darwini]|uniref:SUN domain-containing protein n=1 Tax=Caerostris darwini TaxID=1538125 RepID=A0AAV4UUH6_9ARAC|nr:hypothetical protein CDAR_541631 [Caerostris darwini]